MRSAAGMQLNGGPPPPPTRGQRAPLRFRGGVTRPAHQLVALAALAALRARLPLHNSFSLPGLSDDFREVDPELHIVACAVDSDERVVFSRFHNAHVPISRAAAASSALPVLFRPIRIDGVDYIDGGIKGNASIDVAVEQGATPIVVGNPIVPLDARSMRGPDPMREPMGTGRSDPVRRGI